MDVRLERRLAAEVVGTAILVLFGAGSVVAALRMGGGELEYPGLGMVAFAFAFRDRDRDLRVRDDSPVRTSTRR